jgi:hypothetical protein
VTARNLPKGQALVTPKDPLRAPHFRPEDRPADDPSGELVEYRAAVESSLPCLVFGDVRGVSHNAFVEGAVKLRFTRSSLVATIARLRRPFVSAGRLAGPCSPMTRWISLALTTRPRS